MISRWLTIKITSTLKDLLSVYGAFLVITQVIQFFPSISDYTTPLQSKKFLVVLTVGSMVYALYRNRPRNNFIFKVANRDFKIKLSIGNIDDTNAAYIVPVNTEFDMALNGSVKRAESVQSMVIKKYFGGDFSAIQKQINKILKGSDYSGLKSGNNYELGTTVPVETTDGKNKFYFVANSHKKNGQRVDSTITDFYATLNGLWTFLSAHGAKESLAIPLLGTGNGRLKMTRQDVYKEIVRSFLTSCSNTTYCKSLTIVLRQEDVVEFDIDVDELVDFTRLQTEYADFREKVEPTSGKATD